MAGRLRTALARISSAVLTQANGLAPAFQVAVNSSILAMSSLTEPTLPRRIAPRVRIPNHVSIWFIHDAEVGVKWKVIRGWRSSQARTSGVLWLDTLSRTTWSSPAGGGRPHGGGG